METRAWTKFFPKLAALWGRWWGGCPRATLCRGRQARSTGLQRALPRRPGAGWGARRGRPPASGAEPPGGDALGRARSMVSARPPGHAAQSPGGALAGAAELRAARPDSLPPYWMPQPLLPVLPPPSSPCAAGSRGPSGGEVKQEPAGGRGRRGWRA